MTGRKPDPVRDAKMAKLYRWGVSIQALMQRFGVAQSTVHRALQAHGVVMRGLSLKKGERK